jgi:arsenite methyltransferase
LALTDRLLDTAGLPKGSLVLDMGCGLGGSVRHLGKTRGMRVIGLDRCRADLRQAQKQEQEQDRLRDDPALYVHADMDHPPLGPGRLDAVLCECVASLSTHPGCLMRDIAAMLKPGGWLLFTDLYLRDAEANAHVAGTSAKCASRPNAGCAAGAVDQASLTQNLRNAGLAMIRFEDHTRLLKEFSARLIFAGLDPRQWLYSGNAPLCESVRACSPRMLGYCLILAARRRKTEGRGQRTEDRWQ